jgi:hypothetical protein
LYAFPPVPKPLNLRIGLGLLGAWMSAREGTPAVSFRLPLSARLLSLVGTIVIGLTSVLMVGFLVASLMIDQWLVGVVVALCAAIMLILSRYVARDLQGKWNLRVVLGADSAEFFLPKNRSLIHATPAQHVTVPYAEIAAIETRLEAYPSFGMANLQQPYVLRRKNGEAVFLFEERAVATGLQSSYFGGLIDDLAGRAKIEVRDLGMSEGKGGILGVVHTEEAHWAAPALPRSRQIRLFRRAANTGALAFLLVTFAFMVRWAIAILR